MNYGIFLSFSIYFSILALICRLSYKKKNSASEFIIGDRSANYWVTAISAHASDMSSWLFMGLPAAIYIGGGFHCWAAIGLAIFMFFNWHFIAPKLRQVSEESNSLTLPSLFETRLGDKSGIIRIVSAILSFFFFSFYISSGMIGMGILFESVFQVNYHVGISLSIFMVMLYTFIGGYTTIVWTDFFQGLFLLFVIMLVPFLAFFKIGGLSHICLLAQEKNIILSPFPDASFSSFLQIILITIGWGIGYFGQPHILNKFMGINKTEEIYKSKYVGMSWHILSLSSAVAIGYIGIAYHYKGLANDELIFVEMVKDMFPPIFSGFILCAILAATISTIDSQILVLSSIIAEDLYKKTIRKNASPREELLISRISVLLICILSYLIAFKKNNTVYELVFYAWSGLGASFGPILILTLYSKKLKYYGAVIGMLLGGGLSASWHFFSLFPNLNIPAIIPGFLLGTLSAYLISILPFSFFKKRSKQNQ